MSQSMMILEHLQNNGSITQAEAIDRFGCYRLGARIYDLKGRGFKITRRMEEGVNRFGGRTRYARYTLGRENGTSDTAL